MRAWWLPFQVRESNLLPDTESGVLPHSLRQTEKCWSVCLVCKSNLFIASLQQSLFMTWIETQNENVPVLKCFTLHFHVIPAVCEVVQLAGTIAQWAHKKRIGFANDVFSCYQEGKQGVISVRCCWTFTKVCCYNCFCLLLEQPLRVQGIIKLTLWMVSRFLVTHFISTKERWEQI